jgi:hypothetical protein
VKRSFWCVIAIVFLIGCSAPRERLTFPTTPLSRDDGGEWFDVNRNGKPDFHVMKSANGAVDRLEYDDNEDGADARHAALLSESGAELSAHGAGDQRSANDRFRRSLARSS